MRSPTLSPIPLLRSPEPSPPATDPSFPPDTRWPSDSTDSWAQMQIDYEEANRDKRSMQQECDEMNRSYMLKKIERDQAKYLKTKNYCNMWRIQKRLAAKNLWILPENYRQVADVFTLEDTNLMLYWVDESAILEKIFIKLGRYTEAQAELARANRTRFGKLRAEKTAANKKAVGGNEA